MPDINKSNLISKIQTNINAITTATSAKSMFIASLSADTISPNRSSTVDTVANLPNLYDVSVPDGQVVFVNSVNLPVIANQCKWLGLDGRLLRDDVPPPSVVWSWGCNSFGKLGDNTCVNKSSPVAVVGGFTDWCQVSAGSQHTAAVRTNGTLWSWGYNSRGGLGDNTTVSKSSPISVVGGFTDWCQVSAGSSFTAAVRSNGTLWAWGRNVAGQLGDNTAVAKSSPVSIVGSFTDWCQVSAGSSHTAALRSNGTLWSWGNAGSGRLGDDTIIAKSSPVSVVGGFTNWCQVAAGGCHTTALRTNGTLWAWGDNTFGQLGDNTAVAKSSPVSIVGSFTDWCQVSAGAGHTAAIRTNGTLWAWGLNSFGRLGDNSIVTRSSPVGVVGGFTDWCQVSAASAHTAAIRTNGSLWTWGGNGVGQLGDNTIISRSSPVSVVGGFTDWCQISAGENHTAAIRTNSTLWAWGYNGSGQLGNNTIISNRSPVSVVGGFTDWCQVSAASAHTAAIRTNGSLWTWGFSAGGRLGDNTVLNKSSPVGISFAGDTIWYQVSAVSAHGAALALSPCRGF